MGLRGALEAGRDYCDQSHTFWFRSNTFFSDVLDSVLAILACLLDTVFHLSTNVQFGAWTQPIYG